MSREQRRARRERVWREREERDVLADYGIQPPPTQPATRGGCLFGSSALMALLALIGRAVTR